ncbi:MAG: PLP-dependent aminotransferase family protein [Actinomycetota bacterium]|nr:PLP-dependent aminotransferase family protein [Actinomycetota bacterium]
MAISTRGTDDRIGPPSSGGPTRIAAAGLARRLGSDSGAGPAYRRLAGQIRTAALDGRLINGVGLPSERELALAIKVSRTTVAAAYQQLRDDGWLSSRRGSGSRLTIPREQAPWQTAIFGRSDSGPGRPAMIDLSVASLPAPAEPLRRAVAAAVTDLDHYLVGDGYFPFGLPILRDVVAQRYTAAGAPTSSEQILITSGAQHGLSLAIGALSSPGDRVLIECPSYPVALDAIRAAHRVPTPLPLSIPLPLSDENASSAWDLDLMAAILRQAAPRLGYLIPDFQNPTGALMSADTRQQVVDLAGRTGTTLLVDESFRDVPFDGAPLPPPMAAFGDAAAVLGVGSVSKGFWGGLRVGWVRAAPAVIERLAVARSLGDMAGPVLDQLTVSHLLADPEPALREQTARLSTGAGAVLAALAEQLPNWVPSRPGGGTTLWIRLPGPYATELARLAPAAGVRIVPGPRFGPDGTMESHLRLPFGAPPADLVEAVRRLAGIDAQAATGAGSSSLPGWLA